MKEKLFNADLDIFLDMTPKAQAAKAKMNNWDYVKLKSFHIVKKTMKLKATNWVGENICKLDTW